MRAYAVESRGQRSRSPVVPLESEWIARYARMKNTIKSFVHDYAGRGLILRAPAGMGKRHLLYSAARRAGLDRIFSVASLGPLPGPANQTNLICTLPGDMRERDLLHVLHSFPRALFVLETNPTRFRIRILAEILRCRLLRTPFRGGFLILSDAEEIPERLDPEFERFDLGDPDFEAVLSIARNEAPEIATWMSDPAMGGMGGVDRWAEDIHEVVHAYASSAGMPMDQVQELFRFSIGRFVRLMARCPHVRRDERPERLRWIARELHLLNAEVARGAGI